MALNGINFALAFHGQEAIWKKIYLDLNLTESEIDQHFGGPAFLPWFINYLTFHFFFILLIKIQIGFDELIFFLRARMGNIRGWGGPLSDSWHNHTINLQHKILARMRELGIIPILPAFAGHVPRAFSRIFPNSSFIKINCWNDFQDNYCWYI